MEPFLGRSLLSGDAKAHAAVLPLRETDTIAITIPVAFLGMVPSTLGNLAPRPAAATQPTPLMLNLAAVLGMLLELHQINDDPGKRVFVELVPAQPRPNDLAVVLPYSSWRRKRMVTSAVNEGRVEMQSAGEEPLTFVAVRLWFVADRTPYLPSRSVRAALESILLKHQRVRANPSGNTRLAPRRRQSRAVRPPNDRTAAAASTGGQQAEAFVAAVRRQPALALQTPRDVVRALALLSDYESDAREVPLRGAGAQAGADGGVRAESVAGPLGDGDNKSDRDSESEADADDDPDADDVNDPNHDGNDAGLNDGNDGNYGARADAKDPGGRNDPVVAAADPDSDGDNAIMPQPELLDILDAEPDAEVQVPAPAEADAAPAHLAGPDAPLIGRTMGSERLTARLLQACSLPTAVSAARQLTEAAAPEFGDVPRYRAGDGCIVFPRPDLVFVIERPEQQTTAVLLATQLPRPVAKGRRFVSSERRTYVEARRGPPPRPGVAEGWYFHSTGGRAYTALVGREGTDLLAAQAEQVGMKELCTTNLAQTRRAQGAVARARMDADLLPLPLVPADAKVIPPYGPPSPEATYAADQSAMLRRCRPILCPRFAGHSAASRAAAVELRRYLGVHDHVLFRPWTKPQAHTHLSLLTSWVEQRRTQAVQLYHVHPGRRTHMLLRMMLAVFGANDPQVSGKIHHLALGPAAAGKTYCLNIAVSWSVPGQAVTVTHASAMADTVPGNFDGQIQVWHEANPKLFGVGTRRSRAMTTSPEESRFKTRLTEGVTVSKICTPARRGHPRSVTTLTRHCNGPSLMNLNAKPEQIDPPTLTRFLVSDTWPASTSRQSNAFGHGFGRLGDFDDPSDSTATTTIATSLCGTESPALHDARARDVADQRWLATLVVVANELIRAGALPSVATPFTNRLLPRVLERARLVGGLQQTDEARHVRRVQAAVRTLVLIRAILTCFGNQRSPLGTGPTLSRRHPGIPRDGEAADGDSDDDEDENGPLKFSVQNFALLPMHLSDCLDPSIFSTAMGLIRSMWPEDAWRWRTLEALIARYEFQECNDRLSFGDSAMLVQAAADVADAAGGLAPPQAELKLAAGRARKRRRLNPAVQQPPRQWAIARGAFSFVLVPAQASPKDVTQTLMIQLANRVAAHTATMVIQGTTNVPTRATRLAHTRRTLVDLVEAGDLGFTRGPANSYHLLLTQSVLRSPTELQGRVLQTAVAQELLEIGETTPRAGAHVFGRRALEQHQQNQQEAPQPVAGAARAAESMKRVHLARFGM